MGGRDLPGHQRRTRGWQGAAEQRPGGADRGAGGGGGHPQPHPQPAGGGAELAILLSPRRPTGIHGGQALEPTAVEPVELRLQLQGLLGESNIAQPVHILGEEGVDRGREGDQPLRPSRRIHVRVHGRNLLTPPSNTSTRPKLWMEFFS